ncbi:Cas10/Cmr2 second palm domain-containing protein, partial [Vibrio sinaloensis]|uniref:Cas10/Cmr2 second palm domain-containing protein n=1 Tax=Photobacterium sp. (strain ATCC 43367) TaxID=379097 RepID=UPI002F41B498
FQSGKLKDVISASERLDKLIDSGLDDNGNTVSSVLSHVITAANLTSDIHVDYSIETGPSEKTSLRFLRCKGGAFYCYSNEKQAVQRLRSLWTLTLNQLFPSLEYIDALTESDSLQDGIDKAFKYLAASRNKPQVKLPLALTIFERYQRTGKSAVPLSAQAMKAKHEKEDKDSSLDIDVEKHRQAYQTLEMRDNSSLQKKYTPPEITVDYPLNFDTQFPFQSEQKLKELGAQQKEAIKDIALIHIDGNGMGLLLMALKEKLKVLGDEEYLKGFRTFSDALEKATVRAARTATLKLYETVRRELDENPQNRITLPMRPIVLGGDDVTLYCRADLALDYAKQFCKEFKKESQIALEPVFKSYFRESESHLHPYITASGGILYQKASHPFTQSHDLVELLALKAKKLTKSIYGTDDKTKVGPAALALYRISNATQTTLEDLIENAHIHTMD